MRQRGIKKTVGKKYSPPPTVKHDSSADNAQDIAYNSLPASDKESYKRRSDRKHSGSDGTSKAGRGSNH